MASWKGIDIDEDADKVIELLEKTNLTEDNIRELWRQGDFFINRFVITSPSCSDRLLNEFRDSRLEDDIVDILSIPSEFRRFRQNDQSEVLQKQELPNSTFEQLCSSRTQAYRIAVALNIHTPNTAIEHLRKDSDVDVRDACRARNLGIDYMSARANDYDGYQYGIEQFLYNGYADISAYDWDLLGEFESEVVLGALCLSKGTPDRTLGLLRGIENSLISFKLKFRDLDDFWRYDSVNIIYKKLNDRNFDNLCTTELLNIISTAPSPFEYLRLAVVNHPECPKELLEELKTDNDADVRSAARARL